MTEFFSRLDTSLDNQIREQILGDDTVPSLYTTLSRVHNVSMKSDSSFGVSSSFENCAMVARGRVRGGGRGRGRGCDSGGRECGDKGPCYCVHCGKNNHTSDKYWDKFGKPERAQITDTMFASTSVSTSSIAASTCRFF